MTLKETGKFVWVHFFPAIFVAFVFGFVVIHLAKFITSELVESDLAKFSGLEEPHLELAVLIIIALMAFVVVRSSFDFAKYLWFISFGEEKPACGLYIEGYLAPTKEGKALPTISLIVVYFDPRNEQLKIEGHAFIQREVGNPTFSRHAKWVSKALYFEPNKEDFDIFYIHEGEIVNYIDEGEIVVEKHIRGTTTFDLPSGKNTGHGSFCDLKAIQHERNQSALTLFAANHFNIIRASDEVESVFCSKIQSLWARWLYRRKLSCPGKEAFSDFINEKCLGRDLLKDVQAMIPVWKALH